MSGAGLVKVTKWLIVAAIAVESLIVVGFVFGPYGVGLPLPTPGWWQWEGQAQMSAAGILMEPPAVDVDVAWVNGANGAVDSSTGLPAVELVGPFSASLTFLNPTTAEVVLFVIARVLVPLLAIAVLWLLLRLVSSVGQGTPFTSQNSKRIWWIAVIIGGFGTLATLFVSWVDAWLISNSAAAPAFSIEWSVSLAPLLAGLLVAVLGVAWSRGIALEEETEGLV